MKNRIAISGPMCSGKTFLANAFRDYGHRVVSFATPLKALEQLHVNYKQHNINRIGLKNILKDYASKLKVNEDCINEIIDLFDSLDIVLPKNRELLQKLGTDIVRKYNNNAWCDYLLSSIGPNELVVIDDMRFKNEFNSLKNNGFFLIRIRPDEEKRVSTFLDLYPDVDYYACSKHKSETDLNDYDQMNLFDAYFYNDYTFDAVSNFIARLG